MKNAIDNGMSVYLDLLRFLAAVAVVLSHVWRLIFPDFPLPWPGHAAVIVFFVISGYVIAFATDRPGQTAGRYALYRAVRILSVTIPALLLAVCIAPLSGTFQIPLAGQIPFPASEFWRATWMNMLFLGESSWFGRILPPFNPPYWSLSYEVWYYVIFGAWVFSPARWRLAVVLLSIVFAGLKIALLLPVWLLGVAAYRYRIRLGQDTALRLFILTALFAFAFYWFDWSVLIRSLLQHAAPAFMGSLHGSDQFLGDYILGSIVAVNFVAAASMGSYFSGLIRTQKSVRKLASFTLSSYLMHMPLTVLLWNGLGVHGSVAYVVLLVCGIIVVGSFTERKHRAIRHWLESRCHISQPLEGSTSRPVDRSK
ncbi:acyltransferase family protein [Massilia sp. DWR3-1-1]|uniref:acyltransferase family protein n=1 Tax=Massilia sp. DWR3-1-1 TaxID=2804559 RepID=UPI003CF68699